MREFKHRKKQELASRSRKSAGVGGGQHPSGDLADAFLMCEVALKRFIARFLYRPEDVEELAQETFLRAYDASKKTVIRSPRAYFFRIAKYIALKELDLKSNRLTDYLEEAVEENQLEDETTLEEELIAEQKISNYCNAISMLPPQCRKIFIMRKVQAKTYKEICDTTQLSISAVEKHIANGVQKLDDYFIELDEDHVRQSRAARQWRGGSDEAVTSSSDELNK